MKVEWKTCFRVSVSAFLLFLAIYYWNGLMGGLSLFMSAASPLILGAVIAYLINIPMSFYERCYFPRSNRPLVVKTRRTVCMAAAILTVLGIIALVIGLVIPELVASIELLISWIPDAIDWVVDFVSDSESLAEIIPEDYLNKLENIDWEAWVSKIVSFLSTGIGGAVGTAVGAITSVFSTVVTLVCGIIFALYLLLGKDKLQEQGSRLMKSYLPDAWRERISYVLTVLNDCFHRYVVGQCTEAVILGCLCIVGMWIFRFPYATMIGTLVGFTALIPVAGAYIGAVVGAFMILMVSPVKALLFVIFLTVLQQLEGNLIYPKVVGTSLGLPGMWVLAAVTVGGGLFGILGMLIGVPLVATLYKLIRDDVHKKEGKERVALSRKRRERREKKREKERAQAAQARAEQHARQENAGKKAHDHSHGKDMKAESDHSAESRSESRSRSESDRGAESPSRSEKDRGKQKPGKQQKPNGSQTGEADADESAGQHGKQDVNGNADRTGKQGGNHRSRRRRKRHKSANQSQKENE